MSASSVAAAIIRALTRVQSSPGWAATFDADERAWLAMMALADELHPRGDVTIPSRQAIERLVDRRQRDRAIRESFNGRNYLELAAQHRITVRQIRRIVDRPRPPRNR